MNQTTARDYNSGDKPCRPSLQGVRDETGPVRELQVPAAMASVNHHLEQLFEGLEQLSARLKPVLRVEPAPSPSNNCVEEKLRVPLQANLYDDIRRQAKQVAAAGSLVRELLTALEI
jgi:hypothetical protein